MKRLITLGMILAAMTLVSCRSFSTLTTGKKAAQGSPYEVLVVCNAPEWESEVGELLRQTLEYPVEMLNPAEPSFSVLRVTADGFANMLTEHRNILKVVVTDKVQSASVTAAYDVASAPQIVLTFSAPSHESMIDYLNEHGPSIRQVLEMAERDRTIDYAEKFCEKKISDMILNEFNVGMKVPKGYEFRSLAESFIWVSYEFPTASQGFFIYSFDYHGPKTMDRDNLIYQRCRAASMIPGPAKGSFMTTVTKVPNAEDDGYVPFEPEMRTLEINGRKWIETRGLWETENYFMGGPYVSFTTIDDRTSRVFVLDCYVFSPKKAKRNFLRALEHLVYLLDFDQEER